MPANVEAERSISRAIQNQSQQLSGLSPTALDRQDAVSVHPFRISLDAQRTRERIQATIARPLPPEHYISVFQVSLLFNGVEAAQAIDLRYLPEQKQLLASFDRHELIRSATVWQMAGHVVQADVVGYFIASSGSRGKFVEFAGSDFVEIAAP